MTTKTESPILHAEGFLRKLADNLTPRTKLAPVRALCQSAGVSFFTMWKAAARLCEQGVLVRLRNGRLAIPSASAGEESREHTAAGIMDENLSAEKTWQKIGRQVEQDIIHGIYPPGQPLPLIKELCARHHVTFPTVKKALVDLSARGLLVAHGRRYRAAPLSGTIPQSRIVLLTIQDPSGTMVFSEFDQAFLRSLEPEAARAGLAIDIVLFSPRADTVAFTRPASLEHIDIPASDAVVGYVCLIQLPSHITESMFHMLSHTGKPVAFFDQAGSWSLPAWVHNRRTMKIFSFGTTTRPAAHVARHLMGLGHTRIAYIAPLHAAPWSQHRLRGLMHACARAGCSDAVRIFAFDEYATGDDFEPAGKKRARYNDFMAHYRFWCGTLPKHYRRLLDEMMVPELATRLGWCEAAYLSDRLFHEALSARSVTAWVCANDFIATIAYDFLLERRIAVPQTLSLVGFDDLLETLTRRISSYNWNFHGLALAALRFLLSPKSFHMPEHRGRIEIDGMIVERGTTGKAYQQ